MYTHRVHYQRLPNKYILWPADGSERQTSEKSSELPSCFVCASGFGRVSKLALSASLKMSTRRRLHLGHSCSAAFNIFRWVRSQNNLTPTLCSERQMIRRKCDVLQRILSQYYLKL